MDPTKILAKFKGDFTENPSQNAQIWFNGLPEDVTDTRENLKCEFLKKYQISHGQNFQKLSDFIDLKQQETESVAEYINRVNALSEDQDVGQFKLTKLQYKCKPELVRLMSLGKWPETVEEAEVRLRSVEANFHYLEKCEKKETEDKIISELKPKIDMMFQQISAVNSKSLQQPTASPPMVEPLLMIARPKFNIESERQDDNADVTHATDAVSVTMYHLNVALLESSVINANP
ncbi:unnamed protein product [Mytilus coruscus]|uniref:Retrotransposon gag domain-containing protein n=1 Tax=Mytilus coruscus TaxID=42192 RepID=A0A6J8CE61_MYTCO|nr:unnamed protein product [Mytilus coruscus]